jgi:outer membrane biosynthesis protein TonB
MARNRLTPTTSTPDDGADTPPPSSKEPEVKAIPIAPPPPPPKPSPTVAPAPAPPPAAKANSGAAQAQQSAPAPEPPTRLYRVWAHGTLVRDGRKYRPGDTLDLAPDVAAKIPCLLPV